MSGQTMQRYLVLAGALVPATLLTLMLSVLWERPSHADDYESREVLVKLQPSVSISKINASYRTRTLDALVGGAGIYRLEVPSRSKVDDVVSKMRNDSRLAYAEPNYVAEAPEADARFRARGRSGARADGEAPTEVSGQYAFSALNLSCAQGISRGEGSVVAVLDTGVQLDHPALQANFAGAARYDFVNDDADPSDHPVGLDANANGLTDELVGHGTHVAGIVDLVAPDAKIMPLRILDSEGYGNVFTLVEAISYAERNGANVINVSLSTSEKSMLLENTIKDVSAKGVVVVAAAGNDNTYLEQYPAAIGGEVVSVTSVDQFSRKSGFANYSGWIDVAAPGEDIYSAFTNSEYASWSGTSMAAPFVAGQAALIHSVNPYLDSDDAGSLIGDTARNIDNLQHPDYSGKLGKGHANIGVSLAKLRSTRSCGYGG